MRGVYNSLIELLDSWVLRIFQNIVRKPLLEINVTCSFHISRKQLSDPEDASDQVEGPLCLAIILGFQIVGVLSVDKLHLLYKSIELAHHDVLADHEEPIHETQALLLNILVAVLESIYHSVDNIRLVEGELLCHVLEEHESCLSDWSSMILIVLEWSKIDLNNKLWLDWSLLKSDSNQSIHIIT